jgi:hypothetical protein
MIQTNHESEQLTIEYFFLFFFYIYIGSEIRTSHFCFIRRGLQPIDWIELLSEEFVIFFF